MNLLLRRASLLLICLVTLSACATPWSPASLPSATPAPTARQQAVAAAPSDRLELVAGRYQLLMFYSPL
jgi:hypothetical protein